MKQNKFLSTQIFLGLLIVLVIGLGFNYFFKPFLYKFQTQIDPASLVARQDIPGAGTLGNGLLANLTTEQTIAQLLVLPIFPSSTGDLPDEIATWLKNYQPGFVQLRSMRTSSESADIKPVSLINAQRLIKQITDISKSFTWPSIMMTNFSGGLTELKGEGFVTIPAMKTLCATPDKAEPAIASAAAQLKKLGISMVIGPVVDLNQAAGANGLCSDPQTVVLGSKKFVENFGSEGILPVVAHFPGVGRLIKNQDQSPQSLAVTVSDLKPFQQLFLMYPNLGVLVSPVKISEKFSNQPCSQSKECLASFPKQFPEVVIFAEGVNSFAARAIINISSKSAETNLVIATKSAQATSSAIRAEKISSPAAEISIAESAKLSLLAGVNILMFDSNISPDQLTNLINQLTAMAAVDGELKAAIDASWKKVLTLRAGQNN